MKDHNVSVFHETLKTTMSVSFPQNIKDHNVSQFSTIHEIPRCQLHVDENHNIEYHDVNNTLTKNHNIEYLET